MHLGRSHTSTSSSGLPLDPAPLQTSLTLDLPSLSSSHSINGTQQAQRHLDEATAPTGIPTKPSSLPSASASRKSKRQSNTVNNQEAAQLAKQEIRSKLREDWSWPPISGTPLSQQNVNIPTTESAWRERRDGFETESEETSTVDPYQYEDADAVRPANKTVAQPSETRKRKRQQVLLEEMEWNEGLRHFVKRRDAWSGARTQHHLSIDTDHPSGNVRRKDLSRKRDAIYAPPSAIADSSAGALLDQPSTNHGLSTYQTPSVTLLPLASPLLPPENAVRASITEATYPSIYSKIVVQGLTPTVPINLNDIVGALVRGWKDNDEWPPKSEAERAPMRDGVIDIGDMPSTGVKNGVRRSMGKVKKALGLSGASDGTGGDKGVEVMKESNDVSGIDER